MVIRGGGPADLASIASHYAHQDTPWDPFGSVERLGRIPLDGLLVAEVDGVYAGFLYWYEGTRPYYRPAIERFGRLYELHVKEEFRGRGLARRLIAQFFEDARKRGLHHFFVDTDDDNLVAQRLYESVGYRRYRDDYHYELADPR